MPKAPFTVQGARDLILEKLRKAGPKGAPNGVTPKTSPARRAAIEDALRALEDANAIFADRTKTKPRFFLAEFAPNEATAAHKIDQFAARKHPVLLAASELKKALSKLEQPLLAKAIERLEKERRLLRLLRGKSYVFAHGECLRSMLGAPPVSTQTSIDVSRLRKAYETVAAKTGFPAIEIAELSREAGVDLAETKSWLLDEYRAGRAVFSLGDWSLASERVRAGAIEVRGEPHLLVRLENAS
jgi:hypothetical protein